MRTRAWVWMVTGLVVAGLGCGTLTTGGGAAPVATVTPGPSPTALVLPPTFTPAVAEATSAVAVGPDGQPLPVYDLNDGLETTTVEALPFDVVAQANVISSTFAYNYLVAATAGQAIQVEGDGVGSTDLIFTLIDPQGRIMQRVDDTVFFNPRVVFIAAETGWYTVRVGVYDVQSGAFRIRAQLIDASTADPNFDLTLPVFDMSDGRVTARVQRVALNVPVQGSLPGNDTADNWVFEGRAGQFVRVRVTGLSGLDAVIEVIDPQGNLIEAVDDVVGYDPELPVTLRIDGFYTVRVSAYGAGGYELVVSEQ